MFESVTNWLLGFQFTGLMGITLYWIPLLLCLIVYTLRTLANYYSDVSRRTEYDEFNIKLRKELDETVPSGDVRRLYQAKSKDYNPTDTLGSLIGRGIVTMMPIVNIWAAIFDCAPQLFSGIFKWIDRIFNQPLVPKFKKDQ